MPYTIVDILDKFILLEKNGYEMFMKIASDPEVQHNIKAVAKVFANEEMRHLEIYQQLKKKFELESGIEIDFMIYDKAAKLIFEFSKRDRVIQINNSRDVLEFCLNFEKENLALLLSIQGILVQDQKDTKTNAYHALADIILEEKKHIKDIQGFLKG